MIWRSVPVHAVKTKRRFGPKTASFHVSVYSYVFPDLLLSVCVHVAIHIISYDCLIYFTSITCVISCDIVSIHFNLVVDLTIY